MAARPEYLRPVNEDYESRPIEPPLNPGGGGGTFDGMEARVAALEASTQRMDAKLDKILDEVSKVEVDVARIDGKVSTLPTTLQLLGFVLAVLAIAGFAKYFAP